MGRMADPTSKVRPPLREASGRAVRVGDYYTNGRDLFEVLLVNESVGAGGSEARVLVENAGTGWTAEYDRSSIRKMRLVRRAAEGDHGIP